MNISEHRQAIDRVDAHIVELLNQRTRHILEIGNIKMRAGQEAYAPQRELAVLNRVVRLNHGPLTDVSLRTIYREIMSCALSLQKTLTIAYFGPPATFTHLAEVGGFGSSLNYTPQKTIADVFSEVSKGSADYGVVPIENSTEGVVTHTLDVFVDSELKVVSQIVLPIQQCLIGRGRLAQIRRIYSHPQALAQCRSWVQNHLPRAEIIESSSTTRAAQLAAARDRTTAAIASSLAAERYNLSVIAYNIQDNPHNATRFLVLGRQSPPATGHDRTSLMISVADKVGALHQAIAPFRRYRVNMTKIESRPSKRRAWEYYFFIDCDGHVSEPRVARAIAQLGEHCNFVKVLGSYPNTD